jgi:hypothetical protein
MWSAAVHTLFNEISPDLERENISGWAALSMVDILQ